MAAALPSLSARAQQDEGEGDRGNYEGVTPGLNQKNPLPPPKPGPPQLVWTGFQKAEGGSRVFMQTTQPINYDLVEDDAGGKRLTVLLRNCKIHLKNNQRTLDTRYFDTPVAAVKTRQKRKDVEVTILLKERAAPTPRTEEGPEGSQFLVFEFASTDDSLANSP